MIKNRTVQLIYQTAFCTLGVIGIIASLGIFNYNFSSYFYVYFTNLSNYFCIGIAFAELIETIKKSKDSYVTKTPLLKFIGVLAIFLTFVVFNFLLADDRAVHLNFSVESVLFHVVLPLMYILDWILFYERGNINLLYPIYSVSFPLLYAIYIFVRALILEFNPKAPHIYPYFFLNINTLGFVGVLKWICILGAAFIVAGYIIFGLDKIKFKK